MSSPEQMDSKFDNLLDKLNDVSNGLVAVSSSLSFLSKSVEVYQKRLDDHIQTITGEISSVKENLAVSNSKLHKLESDQDKRTVFSMKAFLTVFGVAGAFMTSLITNIVLLFLKK